MSISSEICYSIFSSSQSKIFVDKLHRFSANDDLFWCVWFTIHMLHVSHLICVCVFLTGERSALCDGVWRKIPNWNSLQKSSTQKSYQREVNILLHKLCFRIWNVTWNGKVYCNFRKLMKKELLCIFMCKGIYFKCTHKFVIFPKGMREIIYVQFTFNSLIMQNIEATHVNIHIYFHESFYDLFIRLLTF